MAQPDGPHSEPPPNCQKLADCLHGIDASLESNKPDGVTSEPQYQTVTDDPDPDQHHVRPQDPVRPGKMRRISRSVVPGLPRAQTFKRQLSERRSRLAPVEPDPEERRAVSVDRRSRAFGTDATIQAEQDPEPRTGAPENLDSAQKASYFPLYATADSYEEEPLTERLSLVFDDRPEELDDDDLSGTRSITSSQEDMDNMIGLELETVWILNLSMRYKDRSNREKFFVTYRENKHNWRRVTVTVDYRDAPDNSLEIELRRTSLQREKSRKIYEAIRESLQEIQFYDTVTNLKLETLEDRLHVHVVEDANEIIQYPLVRNVAHLGCRRIREQDLVFDYHMSGFVYKVSVAGESLIKKEIPGPDTIDEFLYEINALNSLSYSDHVINFYGLVVDEEDTLVKGLLISYADGGALIDVIYDNCKDKRLGLQWSLKERWARQIVHGLADVHESGFVQGDFTLSNIVIDENDNAKIIDINRRGCPVGWEPPEATPLIESQHRISMYIGVKSDLFQLGMVLWALAMEEDEPERQGRPLTFGSKPPVSEWYQQVTEICLDPDPRKRLQASMLLHLFPEEHPPAPHISIDNTSAAHELPVEEIHPDGHVRTPAEDLSTSWWGAGRAYSSIGPPIYQSWNYPPRGRSPPSPLPSHLDDRCESPEGLHNRSAWAANRNIRPSYSDVGDEVRPEGVAQPLTPSPSAEIGPPLSYQDIEHSKIDPHVQESSESSGPIPESSQQAVQGSIEVLGAGNVQITADREDDCAAPKDTPPEKEQDAVCDQVLEETSPNIQAGTTQDNALMAEPNGPLVDTNALGGISSAAGGDSRKDAQAAPEDDENSTTAVAENNLINEAGAAETVVSPPEAKDPLGSQDCFNQEETIPVENPSTCDSAEVSKSIETNHRHGVVTTDHQTLNPAEPFKGTPKDAENEYIAPTDTRDEPVHDAHDSSIGRLDHDSTVENECHPTPEEGATKSPALLTRDDEKVDQEQGSLGAENSLPVDDNKANPQDTTQKDTGTSTDVHDASLCAPASDAGPNAIFQPEASGNTAQTTPKPNQETASPKDLVVGHGDSAPEHTVSEVPKSTERDSHKNLSSVVDPTASMDAVLTQSEAQSQQPLLTDDGMERTGPSTNHDATPRISPITEPPNMQEALVGVGANHLTTEDSFCRDEILDEELQFVPRAGAIPGAIQAPMITTDSTT